jgi:cysteine desulfurase/selenocysteine lyase
MPGERPAVDLNNRASSSAPFEVEAIRQHFPVLNQKVFGKQLVYLDNAATTQKPYLVIDVMNAYYSYENANIHRGIHYLSQKATDAYEDARIKVREFLNAGEDREILFVRGTTEAINLVSQSYGRSEVKAGDEILISGMEHHSNIVPWQILAQEKEAKLRVVPINDRGELLMEEFERMIGPRTKIVAVTQISNALGTINPVREIAALAHRRGVPVLVDGAQAVPHTRVDVRELDCDFYAFSGHKLFGPTGIGVLYGKEKLLEKMPPYQGGGDMISSVTFEKTEYNRLPYKFEAGTPHIAGVIGLGAAVDYLHAIGMDRIAAYEQDLLDYATRALASIKGLRIIGTAAKRASILSFVLENIHAHDIGTVLDQEGVAIRAGHHCAMPLMERFGVAATARASLAFYNTREEIDALVKGIHKAIGVFS